MDFPSAWHLWLIAGLIAGALEIKLSGFVMLWFGVGAAAAALAALVGMPLAGQLGLFIVVSIGLFAASRTIFQKVFMKDVPTMRTGAEAMIGAEAVVTEALKPSKNGAVRVNGEQWNARSLDGPIEVGEIVQIESVDGLKLHVRRLHDAPIVVHREEKSK